MEVSATGEATISIAAQKLTSILRSTTIYYHIQKLFKYNAIIISKCLSLQKPIISTPYVGKYRAALTASVV
jgi:hypothetical protein